MPATSRTWLKITLLAALLDWLAVGLSWLPLEYVAKSLTLASLIGYVRTLRPVAADPRLARWIEVGLVLSLVGDVCLLFEGQRWFLAGLVSFLLAHVAYIVALDVRGAPLRHPAAPLLLLGIGSVALPLMAHIVAAVQQRGEAALVGPVLLYGLVISTMLFAAWLTLLRGSWTPRARGLAVGGASLFYLSDALLAWNRFVRPIRNGQLLVHLTYHLGQIALASIVAAAPAESAR